ncbi:hypothetical protein [Cryobacterium sp. Y62]|uniref:hypothetical protein n=1 Tax=Cryobacterium sp. Y62 TaxID=2048284 RepID=UPI000CE41C06|nr:hypothetical protein [Cryobacterium sp. Y62]
MSTSNDKPKSYADTIAPAPHWGDDGITADQVIRSALVSSQHQLEWMHESMHVDMKLERGTDAYKAAVAKTMIHTMNFITQSIVADLFSTIQRVAPDEADAIASNFVDHSESGDYYPEVIWDWMTARGIDPEQIRTETAEEIAASKTTEPNTAEAVETSN